MTELKDKLPRAGAIMYSFGWNSINLPPDSYDDMIEMMHEYCKQVIDVIAESAEDKKEWRDKLIGHYNARGQWIVSDQWKPIITRPMNPTDIEFRTLINKESILKFKELLK